LALNRTKGALRFCLGFEGLDTDEHDLILRIALVFSTMAVVLRFFFWRCTYRIENAKEYLTKAREMPAQVRPTP
jgi:hypothetical protein